MSEATSQCVPSPRFGYVQIVDGLQAIIINIILVCLITVLCLLNC